MSSSFLVCNFYKSPNSQNAARIPDPLYLQ
jgi:hypothetical protein